MKRIARRLKLSRSRAASLEAVTRYHGYPLRMAIQGQVPTAAELRRFQAKLGVYLQDLWILHQAHGPADPAVDRLFEPLPRIQIEPALKGRHLIAAGYRHADSPRTLEELNFSEVLERAFERQLETGEFDPQQLLAWALTDDG